MGRKQSWMLSIALALMVIGLAGCGGGEDEPGATTGNTASVASDEIQSATGAAPPASAPAAKAGGVGALTAAVSNTPRKIIYTAQVNLVVENLSPAQANLAKLVRANRGYIADTSISGQTGGQRQGTWKVRVPVERFDAFMAGASRLGELQSLTSNSQDVSEEYYDVAARIRNKQVEEARLLKHLQQSTGKLREILEVEREISRVRGEIEQMQGRIRVLANLSSLTTITIAISEIKDYVAPKPPTFATEIARTFGSSLDAIRALGKSAVLFVVALAPWLPIILLISVPLWRLRRKFRAPRG